ncbi:MAG: pilus assembly protein TadG-related protein, partial [Acidimicrobiales bacterium]
MEHVSGLRRDRRQPQERGAILVMTALVMLIMLMIAAFATDLGAWYRQAQEQQRTADLGSLNAIQSYEQKRTADFETLSVSAWAEITDATVRETLERDAMQEAVDAVIGVLNAAGSTVTITATNPSWQDPLGDPAVPTETVVTIQTNDGQTVVVTRTVDLDISVSVTGQGDQYFSSFIQDAPEIERSSTATLSNCGAICDVPIVINPPFVGFSGSGSGDGFRPLIYVAAEEVWAVNHHRRKGATNGEIVCMDQNTQSFCSTGGLYGLGTYATHNRPAEEYLHQATGKIYFTARDWNDDRTG